MNTCRTLVAAVSAALAFAICAAGPAVAADSAAGTTAQGQSEAMLTVGDASAVTPMALPSGCIGYSDVWKSSTDGGRANGSGIIDCTHSFAKLYDSTSLYRDRWYGQQFLDSDTSTAYNSAWVSSISIWRCAGAGTYTYRSYAYHEATTAGGTRYTANTSDSARFSC